MAEQIAELARRSLRRNFRRIDPASAQVLLFDGGQEPLATFGNRLRAIATKDREHREPDNDGDGLHGGHYGPGPITLP
jgi:NADH:ubiquinone reductase (H+-translocating)